MFREIVRARQALSRDECVAILTRELRGVLAVQGDDGYPYAVPINHYYCPGDGHLYFHSGPTGHKMDAIRRCPKASFCVTDGGERQEGQWFLRFRSVIVFGEVRMVEDHQRALDISCALSRKFTDDEDYIRREVEQSGARVACFELIPQHITGKLVNER
ncbi:MAG: pyridoxamine 5'-phosphate oxidase family protein [Oscillospiraceae bacterium]|nr:pyridoxamine 5'-phosphate oxidase family protein [Oscillospiraceae bacterium]